MLAVVSGSGIDLTPLLGTIHSDRPFDDFPKLTSSAVAGHACRFIEGNLASAPGQKIILQSGRRHAYEGLSYVDTVRTVDVLKALGATRILLTNAVGALDAALRPGDIVAMEASLVWPFPAFDLPHMIQPGFIPSDHADAAGLNCFMHGPAYETHAEIAALQALGGMTVGMSTAPELHRCNQIGIPAGALSVVTNQCGVPDTLDHNDVVAVSKAASTRLIKIIQQTLHP